MHTAPSNDVTEHIGPESCHRAVGLLLSFTLTGGLASAHASSLHFAGSVNLFRLNATSSHVHMEEDGTDSHGDTMVSEYEYDYA